MMHLVGAGSDVRVGRTMSGLDKSKKPDADSKALKFNQKQGVEENEDNAANKLQSQINTLREKIREISENETMDAKTKAELIQSTKEQISELSQQLKQRQLDIRQEQLEKEEEAQKESKLPSPNDKEISENSGKSKYDTYTEDDEVTLINAAVISASNQVDIAKKQKYFSTYKNNQIKILDREVEIDTKLVQRKEVTGHDKKTIEEVMRDNANATEGEASERIKAALEKAQAENDPALKKEIESVHIEEIWELNRGFAVEKKEEEISKLKAEISGLNKTEAQSLGNANRIIDGEKEDPKEEEEDKIKFENSVKTSEDK